MIRAWVLVCAALLCVSTQAQAQSVISASRRIDWSQAGVPGSIPNRTTICATLNSGATSAQINAAIASCPSGQVVKLNPGTYPITAGVVFNNKSNVTLRGSGPDQTFLVFTSGSGCGGLGGDLCFINGDANWSGDPRNVANWTGGYTPGSTQITLSSTANLKVGSLIILDQLDDSTTDTGQIWVCQTINVCSQQVGAGNGRTNRAQNQVVQVKAISGNTVTISPGVYMPNWRSSQQPQAWWSNSLPISGSGVEDLSMDHSTTASNVNAGTFFFNAYGCWLKNIRDINSKEKHVWMYQSAHLTVRDSYFYGTQNAASESYGTDQFSSSDNLVENNIFQHVANPMMNEGASGSVHAYNFSADDYYTAGGNAPGWQQSSSYHHAAGNYYILWEGNSGAGLTADDIHGTSHFVTAFRNYWTGRDTVLKFQQTNAIHLEAFNRYYNIIGNVLGTPGYHTRYESAAISATDAGSAANANASIYVLGYSGNEGRRGQFANDPLTKTTMMRWGNYDTMNGANRFVASEVPSGLSLYANAVPADSTLPVSLYLSTKPGWWSANVAWPPIGPDVTGGTIAGLAGHAHQIPARLCYLNVMKGLLDGSSGLLPFNATNCYQGTGGGITPPLPPENVRILR
jgi:hypothetical protein